MSLFLTDEQQLLKESAAEFTKRYIAPRVLEASDHEKSAAFHREVFKEACKAGFLTLTLPTDIGGQAQPDASLFLVLEEIAKESPAFAEFLNIQVRGALLINRIPEMARQWGAKLFDGEAVFAACFTDPAGNINLSEWATGAVRDGDDYVLNGTKHFTSQGYFSDFLVAQLLDEAGDLRLFYIPTDYPGVTMSEQPKMGVGYAFGYTQLKNVRVPADWSFDLSYWVKGRERLFNKNEWRSQDVATAAIALGAAEGALDKTIAYLTGRTNKGVPIASKSVIHDKLARMRTLIEAARALTYDATRLYDEGKHENLNLMVHACKAWVPEVAIEITRECITLHGGLGYLVDTGIEYYLRDSIGLAIADNTSDMHYATMAYCMDLPESSNATM